MNFFLVCTNVLSLTELPLESAAQNRDFSGLALDVKSLKWDGLALWVLNHGK